MSGKPPPYPEGTASSQLEEGMSKMTIGTTSLDADTEKALVFVKTMIHSDFKDCAWAHMDVDGRLGFGRRRLYAYPNMISRNITDLMAVVPITLKSTTTFESLVNEIMPCVIMNPNVKAAERGYKPVPVKVAHIRAKWKGGGNSLVGPTNHRGLGRLLEKMKQRGWEDRLILNLQFET